MSDEKKGTYWCCAADFGDHEETCANYKPVTADQLCSDNAMLKAEVRRLLTLIESVVK